MYMDDSSYEILVNKDGSLSKGQQGGVGEVLRRLDQIEAKIDIILEKAGKIDRIEFNTPPAQTG